MEAVILPPSAEVLAEYQRRGPLGEDAKRVAYRRGRSAKLSELMLDAIEMGARVDEAAFIEQAMREPAALGSPDDVKVRFPPHTDEQRAALRRSVEERVRNATPEQRAEVERLRGKARRLHLGDAAHRATRALVSGDC